MGEKRERFISAEVSVVRDEKTGQPLAFNWGGQDYQITEIIAAWPDYGFSAGAPPKKNWRMRRHRNFYRVETDGGQVFEIYHDRGVKPDAGRWVLMTQII